MADDYDLAMQAAIVAALKSDAGVTALVGQRIYDEPVKPIVYPYVHIPEINDSPWDTTCTEGATVGIGIHVYSRSPAGSEEVKRIAGAVRKALHRNEAALTVENLNLVELIYQTRVTDRDPEGRGFTSRMAFQALLEAPA